MEEILENKFGSDVAKLITVYIQWNEEQKRLPTLYHPELMARSVYCHHNLCRCWRKSEAETEEWAGKTTTYAVCMYCGTRYIRYTCFGSSYTFGPDDQVSFTPKSF